MVETSEQVLEEARERGETLLTKQFVSLIERHHPNEQGASRELLEAYDEAIANDDMVPFEAGEVTSAVENRSVDEETWVDDEAVYVIGDGRVSIFPARWHDELGETTDLRAYVSVIEDVIGGADPDADEPQGGTGTSVGGGVGSGVPEQLLLDAAAVIGGLEREAAKDQLEERRNNDELVQDADQHPEARVYLSEETDDMKDDWLN
jgi:hypothetical protein